jgi:hypothetical protein
MLPSFLNLLRGLDLLRRDEGRALDRRLRKFRLVALDRVVRVSRFQVRLDVMFHRAAEAQAIFAFLSILVAVAVFVMSISSLFSSSVCVTYYAGAHPASGFELGFVSPR